MLESHQYGKKFIIGAVTFLMATAAFIGVECVVAIGGALIVLAFCAHFLTKRGILETIKKGG